MEIYEYFTEKWAHDLDTNIQVPDRLICPLTNRIYQQPVMLCNGRVYDQEMLQQKLQENPGKDPIT